MVQHGGSTTSMLAAPVPGSLPLRTYRDSIRRVSVSGGLCRSALVLFTTSGSDTEAEAGDEAWSSASSASSPGPAALDAWAARCSPLSSSFSSGWEAAEDPDGVEELRAIARQMVHDGYMQCLIRAFGAGRPGLEESLLGSWFSELDVEWVLWIGEGDHMDLEDGCASLLDMMERWIKALKTMVQVLCITQQELFAKRPPGFRKALWHLMLLATGKMAEREQEVAHFVRFAEASILRMLDFVDAVADAALNDDHSPDQTLPGMLLVYTCVMDDSPAVLALLKEASMFDDMNSVFLRKMNRLSDAIWGMMEKVRASFVTDDCWKVSSAEQAGGVHKTTRLVMNYMMLLSRNERALNRILQDQQHHMSHPADYYYSSSSVDTLIKDLISCLEKQLEKTSNFISEPGLRYIFLMNNCSFVSQKVSSLLLPSWTLFQDYKIERPKKRDSRERLPPMDDYVNQPDPNLREQIETDSNLDGLVMIQSFIEAYLDASWEPVLSCLYHDIPRGFHKLGGRLDNFEYELQRTFDMQWQWKVPNPELRKRLRRAVIEKVVPGYSKYLEERMAKGKSTRLPKNTPLELEKQFKNLFEG